MEELFDLPQIVSGRTPAVRERAAALFRHLTDSIVELEPEEAELAKLFTNTWRYIKFAAANQFYVMANDHGLDFDVIRKALAYDYPRAADMPGAGFAAGPVPVQGHDAAGGVHRQLVRPRPLGDAGQRGPAALPRLPPGEEVRPGRTSPSASSGWRSRARATTSGRACPTSCKRILAVPGRRGALHRPVRHGRPTRCCRSTRSSSESDILDHRRPAPAVPRRLGRRVAVVDVWNLLGQGHDRMSVAVSVVIPAYNEGEAIVPVLDRIFDAVESDCEMLRRRRLRGGHHRPGARRIRASTSRGCARWSTPTAADRPTPSATASTRSQTPVVVVTMADGSDDPRQIDPLARLVDRGVVVAAASRYTRRRPAGRRTAGQGRAVRGRPAGR